jgi:hypothetical protein
MPVVSREKVFRAYRNALATGDTEAVTALRAVLAGRTTPRPTPAPRETGIFEDITSGFGAGVVGVGEMAALGLAAPLEEESELAAREKIQSIAESFRPEGGDPESVTYKLSSALGSIAGLASIPVAAGIAGAPGTAALGLGALAAGAAGTGEASERARAAGATEQERGEAALRGTAIGLLDILPVAKVVKFADLPTLNKLIDKIPPEKVETIGERIYSAGVTGGFEGAQEAASNVLQNLNEQEYNAAAETFGGTAEEAALGGGAGAILQGLVDLFAPRKAGKTVGDAVEEADVPAGTQIELFDDAERRTPKIDEVIDDIDQEERDRLFEGERAAEVSPDQLPLPGLEPERVGPQLQGLPAPEGETIAGETLAVTPEGEALGREEQRERLARRTREQSITEEPVSDEVRTGRERAEIAQREQPDLFPTELAVAEEAAVAPEAAPALETRPVTEEDLTTAGFAPNAAVRKRVIGKDLDDPEVRVELTNEANRLKSQKVRRGVTRLLEGVPSEQRDLPTPRKREPVAARSGTGDAVDISGVEPTAVGEDTAIAAVPDGRAVGDVGRSVGQPAAGARKQRGALARKVTSAVAKVNAARTEVTKAEEAVTTKPTQANQRKLARAEKKLEKATEEGVKANEQLADIGEEVIPQETVEAQRRAERAMPATAAATPATVEEVLAKEPTPAPAEPTVEEPAADVDLRAPEEKTADKQSLLAERRAERDRLVKEEGLSKADAMRVASEQVLNAPPRDYTEVLDASLPDTVKRAVRNNELRRALLELANKSGDKFISRVAKKLSDFTGDTKIMIVPPSQLGTVDGRQVDGRFITADNTIVLNKDYTDVYVLLHEMAHAATINTLKNPSHPTTKKLMKLHEASKEYLRNSYGSKNVAEFVAEAFTNPTFQGELARINPDGRPLSVWQEFIRVVSNFLGLGKERGTAQREAQQLIEDILAPAAKHRGAPLLASMTDPAGVRRVEKRLKDALPKGPIARAKERIVGEYGALTAGQKNTGLKRKILGFLPNNAVEVELERAGVVGVDKVFAAIENQRGGLTTAEQAVRNSLQPIREWAAKQSGETVKAWNNLIYDSTVDQVDPELTPQQAQKRYGTEPVDGTKQLKIDRYKELRAIYNSKTVGAGGRENYTALRKLYKDQYDQLNDTLQNRIDGLPIAEQAKTNLKNGLYAKMLEATKLEPYFPLTRTGTYFLSVKNPKEGADSAVFAYENAAERFRAAEAYEAEGYEISTFSPSDKASYEDAPSGSFVSSILGIMEAQKQGMTPAQKENFNEVQEQITRLFIEYLPESSFAKSLLRRKGTEGYDVDAVEAARTKAFDLARQVERIKNSRLIDNAVQEMLEANPKMADANSPEIEEVKDRARFAVNPPLDSFAKNSNRMAFMWTIGFNASSALVNLSQIPLFAYPMLAGKYGFGATRDALGGATKLFMGSPTNKDIATLVGDARTPRSIREALRKGDLNAAREALKDKAMPSLDNYYTFSRDKDGKVSYEVRKDLNIDKERADELIDLLPLMELAARRGQLNSSFIADTLSTSQAGRKMSKMDAVTNASALMFHEAEVMNRQVTMVAAYKLALKKFNGDKKKAAEEAVRETQLINGGATLETGPRYARESLGRIALMYKAYGIQMYYTMFKSGRQAVENFFPGDDAKSRELRNEALKQLAGVHLSALFFAGVQGLPLYGAVSMLIDMFREDYEEDTDTMLRQYLDSEVLFKGALSEITGVDVSQRVKLTDLLFEADRFNSDPSPEEEIAHLFGGPAWSIYARGREGIDKLREGEIERGIEDLMPGAVRNAYKAVIRYPRDEGILTRRGDPIYDDLTNGDLLTQLLGFPPVDYTRQADETSTAKRLDIAASAKRRDLLRRYYVAKRFGDREGMRDARQSMREFNESRAVRRDRQKRITGDTIDRSIRGHETRSAEMHNGTTLSPYMKRTVDSGEGFL